MTKFEALAVGDLYRTTSGMQRYIKIKEVKTKSGGTLNSCSVSGFTFNHTGFDVVRCTNIRPLRFKRMTVSAQSKDDPLHAYDGMPVICEVREDDEHVSVYPCCGKTSRMTVPVKNLFNGWRKYWWD